MKKILTLLILTTAAQIYSQSFQPTIGINYTGGFTYEMDQELFSAKAGILYTPKDKKSFIKNVEFSANYYYNFFPKKPGTYDFYHIKLQAAKGIVENWNIALYGGFVNNFENDFMKPFGGDLKTNLSYGIGVQYYDDFITTEILVEQLAGHPHLSIGITYKFKKFKKAK